MCSIYVINIGANTSHKSQARSPIFNCNSFMFVSFCTEKDEDNPTAYPKKMLPFMSPHKENLKTHNDPDWEKLTYGDDCSTRRAAILKKVKRGDILLFWGLLYHNECSNWKSYIGKKGACWKYFTKPIDDNKGWYILGAMRVERIIKTRNDLEDLYPRDRRRAEKNVHLLSENILDHHRIFLGNEDKKYSRLFDKSVALWVPKSNSQNEWESSLMHKYFRSADRKCLSLNDGPLWSSSLRSCRKMWDLNNCEECKLAECVRDAIQKDNKEFNLLENLYFERTD